MALKPQQVAFLENFSNPESDTYSSYRGSALKAGYSETYANNIGGQLPQWLSDFMGINDVAVKEIVEGIKKETVAEKPFERLKAWELLGKYKRMFTEKVDLTSNGKEITLNVIQYGNNNSLPLPAEELPADISSK